MKKLFLGLAMAAGTLVFAQEQKKQVQTGAVRFGIKAGGNAASFSEQELSIKIMKLGFHAGGFVNIPISQKFSIQPEVLYNQLGAENVDVAVAAASEKIKGYKASLNYISVPLMIQMRPTRNFYIEAGPEFSYFLNGKIKGERAVVTGTADGATVVVTESYSEDINKDTINKLNVGLGLGLGYDFSNHLGMNARYVNSLTDIAKDRLDGQNTVNNRVFQLGLNYKF
ncbi:opacity protein-like surface antigen [Chryseobacterium sp. H1D6B]|uniref:porin family protein n=1 Tax=Chryseobacterium sp. H1D6B TaxID=2940588 RepID=UPI0015CA8C8A|nr:porin family protein [Chryseobacterium sp. H1D6B]MDH6253731.1 opacity protein-like surface antigen [Chryseobacterium sp. H1D6B]